MKIQIKGDVYAVGDIHGDTSALSFLIKEKDIKDCTLILLGDIGIWRYRDYKRYTAFDKLCNEHNIITYAFRGNHDNPAFFYNIENQSLVAKRFWAKFTNFKVLPDLTEIDINGATGIVIGGGVSIDRCCRRTFKSSYRSYGNLYKLNDWWENENIPKTAGIIKNFDFILSHTGPRPTKAAPLNKNNCSFFAMDPDLQDAINAEYMRLEEIQKQFNPIKWWFGHYHINDTFDYFSTRCYTVDINCLTPIQI